MKTMKLFYFFIFALSITILSSCGGTDEEEPEPQKTAEEIAVEKLTGESSSTWVVTGGSVTHKGSNVTSDYIDFSLKLSAVGSNRTYTTTNGGHLFDESGRWSFSGNAYGKIMLGGDQPAADKEISFSGASNTLILEFNVPTPENAKVNALAGDYRFELKKE